MTERENRVINIVKAQYGFDNKSEAISFIVKTFEKRELEPELRPKFVEEIEKTRKNGRFVKVDDFAKEFGLEK